MRDICVNHMLSLFELMAINLFNELSFAAFAHRSVLSMGSDDVLLKEIDICVDVWTRQCGKAMLNGSLEDYYMQKNQVCDIIYCPVHSF